MLEIGLELIGRGVVDGAVDEADLFNEAEVVIAELTGIIFIEFFDQVFYVFAFFEEVEHIGNGWSGGIEFSDL